MTEPTRSIYFLNDYSMETARKRWQAGDYPGHHLWGMNAVADLGWQVDFSPAPVLEAARVPKLPGLNGNNRFALNLTLAPPASPNVYCGSLQIYRVLGLMKSLGLFRRKLIVMVHHPVAPSAANRRALGAATAIFFLNQFAHDRTVAAMPELRERSHVLGWCVDTAFYDAQIEQAPPANTKLIVAAGKELRDYESLVQGVAMVDDPDLRVEIYCSEETAPTATDPRVTVLKGGKHGSSISYLDLLRRYRDAIAVAIPMLPVDRTVGMTSVFDAFAARRATIITRHPCIDAPIAAEDLGIVVEPHSAEGWAQAIREILADPDRMIRIGANGRAYADTHLSMSEYGARLDQLFRRYFS